MILCLESDRKLEKLANLLTESSGNAWKKVIDSLIKASCEIFLTFREKRKTEEKKTATLLEIVEKKEKKGRNDGC